MNLQEDYCSFELAKLLKEKGFDWDCHQYDFEDWEKRHSTITSIRPYNFNEDDKCISIPTHQMAMKWLREVHKIFISIGIGDDIDGVFGYMAEIYCLEGLSCPYGEYRYIPNVDADTISDKTAITYEEAVEAALKYSLNLI